MWVYKYECKNCLLDFYIDEDSIKFCPDCGHMALERRYDDDNSVQPECD